MQLVDGKQLAHKIEHDVRRRIRNHNLGVTTIMIKGFRASALYARMKDEACQRVGIKHRTITFSDDISLREVLKTIYDLNENLDVQGIMVQQPLAAIPFDRVVSAIDPKKDVEGMHPYNLGQTLLGHEHLVPCTPRAVLAILADQRVALKAKKVVVVNHSPVVGKPLAILMLNRNATVTVCHKYTTNLAAYTSQGDIVVTGAGVKGLINGEHVKPGSVVIDIAIVPDKQGVCGDVDLDSVGKKAAILTPVPGGVGPVTIACLLENVLTAAGIEKS